MFLDIGAGEVIVLVVLAAIFLGPDRVPPIAKKIGRVLKFVRKIANNATDQIKAELGEEYADLGLDDLKPKNLAATVLPNDIASEMATLRAELEGMRTEMTRLQLHSGVNPLTSAAKSRISSSNPQAASVVDESVSSAQESASQVAEEMASLTDAMKTILKP